VIRKNDEVFGLLKHLAQDKDGDAQQATQYAQDAVLCLADEDEDSDMSETLVQESPIEDVSGANGLAQVQHPGQGRKVSDSPSSGKATCHLLTVVNPSHQHH